MKLNILSSNIRFANPADGKNDWEFRRPHLLKLINELEIDILGTQEGREVQLRDLARGLKGLVMVDTHRSWIEERMYPCLFINPEKIELIRSGDIWLSETPDIAASKSYDSLFPRLCIWAEIVLKETGFKMMIINTHLDHVLRITRMMQSRVLMKEINKISSDPKILMGDFNEPPNTFIKEELMKKLNLKDPWDEHGHEEETSHHSFKGVGTQGDRIDWILVSKNFDVPEIRLEKKDFEGVYPSDHFPLFATVIPK